MLVTSSLHIHFLHAVSDEHTLRSTCWSTSVQGLNTEIMSVLVSVVTNVLIDSYKW